MRMTVVACLLWLGSALAYSQPGAAAPRTPCAAPEQRQLEFWVGEWDLTWPGEKQGEVAHGTNAGECSRRAWWKRTFRAGRRCTCAG